MSHLLAIALSVYDVPAQPNKVVIEACVALKCVRTVAKRDVLDDEAALDAIASKLRSQFETR